MPVISFLNRLTSVESTAGENFDLLTAVQATIQKLQKQNPTLSDKLNDLKNGEPTTGILNIPEGSEKGKDPRGSPTHLAWREHTGSRLLDQVNDKPLVPSLVSLSWFQQKEAVLRSQR